MGQAGSGRGLKDMLQSHVKQSRRRSSLAMLNVDSCCSDEYSAHVDG